MDTNIQTPRGTKDILPGDQKYWHFLRGIFTKKCESFGYTRIDTPVIEQAELFYKKINNQTDTKKLYEIQPADATTTTSRNPKQTFVLRPEMTLSVARSYIQHTMKNWSQPVKLYYEGQVFYYDSTQNGRHHITNQIGVEIFGDPNPFTDASLIFFAYQMMQKIGLASNLVVDINSVGCTTCRVKMKKKLTEYFEKFLPTLCPDCHERYADNPLRIFQCKEEKCQRTMAGAPQLIDLLCSDCKTHFKSVLENLDNLQIPYNLNSRLIKDIDRYTKTVFEFYDTNDTEKQFALVGGGRYDNLIKSLGQATTPALGFTAEMERLIEKIKSRGLTLPASNSIDICLVQIGEKAQKKCLPLVAELEEKKYNVFCNLGKDSLKDQLAMASQMKAKIALIIGQREVLDSSIIVRDIEEASQETIKMTKLFDVLENKLK